MDLRSPFQAFNKHRIEKVELTFQGALVFDAVKIFQMIFSEYGSGGLMYKNDCKKLQKKIKSDSLLFEE